MFKLRFSSITLLVAVGLGLFAGRPTPSSAQVTCGWCEEWTGPGLRWGIFPWYGTQHKFHSTGGCNWPRPDPDDDSEIKCSRCGGDSDCHFDSDWGPCHMACGGSGDLAQAVGDIQKGIDTGDIGQVASLVLSGKAGLSIEYIPEAGRIDFVLSCDPERAAHTIAVHPQVRKALGIHLVHAAEPATAVGR